MKIHHLIPQRKKLNLFLVLCISFLKLNAQSNPNENNRTLPLFVLKPSNTYQLDDELKTFLVAEINPSTKKYLDDNKPDIVNLEIPLTSSQKIIVQLSKKQLMPEDAPLYTLSGNHERQMVKNYKKGLYYQGKILGAKNRAHR